MDTDPGNVWKEILLILVLVILNGFFAAAEMSLVSVRRTRIKQLVEEGNPRALTVLKLIDKPTNFMATIQIGVTMVSLLASAFAAVGLTAYPTKWLQMLGISASAANSIAVFLTTLIVGFVTIVVGEIFPKSLGMQFAESFSLRIGGIIRGLSIITLPAVKIITFCSDLLVKPWGGQVKFSTPMVTEEELKMLVEASEEEGVIEEEEKEMIHSIFDFTDTVVKQVMVPRTDMDCASITSSIPDLLDVITNSGHSRIPIYEDNVDNIQGVIHAKDLLRYLGKGRIDDFDTRHVMREPYFIPESKDVDELLAEFQRDNIQLAIVRDEYGGTAGLVTVEDLLEEIVGEIRDEYDTTEEPLLQKAPDGTFMVNAKMRVDEFNEEMDQDIPEDEDYETVGGFVFDMFGHQPSEGDVIDYKNLSFKVAEVDSGRIQKLFISWIEKDAEDSEEGESDIKNK